MLLAAAVLRAQGIDVTLVCFVTPFLGRHQPEMAAHLGLPLMEVDLTDKYLPLFMIHPQGLAGATTKPSTATPLCSGRPGL